MPNPEPFGRAKYLKSQTLLHDAWDIRPSVYGVPPGPGVAGYQDMRVMQRQAGANMSVDVGATGVGLMTAWVRGTSRGGQGLYECTNIDWAAPTADTYLTQRNVTVTANASGQPRLDIIVLEVLDAQHVGASNTCQLRCIAGTGTAGATLDNRTGAPAIPASSILLADILVPNGAATIVTADIRDRRAYVLPGVLPAVDLISPTLIDQVALTPHPLHVVVQTVGVDHATHDLKQAAALVYLPRRIVGATRLRWRYAQTGVALTGNYNIGIYDASGRLIISTGSVAFTGALNTIQNRSETISATTLEAGWHYTAIGVDTGAGGAYFSGMLIAPTANSFPVPVPNLGLYSGAGGTTLPSRMGTNLVEVATLTAVTAIPSVPLIALSVG